MKKSQLYFGCGISEKEIVRAFNLTLRKENHPVRTFFDNLKWRRVFGRTKRLLAYRATSRCLIPLLKGNGALTHAEGK
jgi:hypothetical protein